jgi:hypothetical protein
LARLMRSAQTGSGQRGSDDDMTTIISAWTGSARPDHPPNDKSCHPILLPPTSNLQTPFTRPILPRSSLDIHSTLYEATQNSPSALTLLKRLHVTRSKRDPDLVDLGRGGTGLVELLVVVHADGFGFGFGDVVVGGDARGETAT